MVREILVFFKVGGKVREFCKMVKEILCYYQESQKSGNFVILVQKMFGCGRYIIHFEY